MSIKRGRVTLGLPDDVSLTRRFVQLLRGANSAQPLIYLDAAAESLGVKKPRLLGISCVLESAGLIQRHATSSLESGVRWSLLRREGEGLAEKAASSAAAMDHTLAGDTAWAAEAGDRRRLPDVAASLALAAALSPCVVAATEAELALTPELRPLAPSTRSAGAAGAAGVAGAAEAEAVALRTSVGRLRDVLTGYEELVALQEEAVRAQVRAPELRSQCFLTPRDLHQLELLPSGPTRRTSLVVRAPAGTVIEIPDPDDGIAAESVGGGGGGLLPSLRRYQILMRAPTPQPLGGDATITPWLVGCYHNSASGGEDTEKGRGAVGVDAGGAPIYGLFDEDLDVDLDDFFLFADHFGRELSEQAFDQLFDLDESGAVDFADFFLLADHFGQQAVSR